MRTRKSLSGTAAALLVMMWLADVSAGEAPRASVPGTAASVGNNGRESKPMPTLKLGSTVIHVENGAKKILDFYHACEHLTAVAYPDYWQAGKPYLDQVDLRVLPDQQTGLAALEAGFVDFLIGAPGLDAQRLRGDAGHRVLLTGNGNTFYYLGLDVNTPVSYTHLTLPTILRV